MTASAPAPPRPSPVPSPVPPTPAPSASADSSASSLFAYWREDLPASLVVFLVALPLCLGIALASGAPLLSGVIAGVVGGIVVGAVSGSQLMVSGPAAGLTAIVISGIAQVGGFPQFLPAVIIGGAIQMMLGVARAGVIGYYFPSSVIKGMLAAIGLTLILKQLPHAVGYDEDFEGDFSFVSPTGETTFGALGSALDNIQLGAVIVSLIGVALMIIWPRTPLKKIKLLPAPLAAVFVGVMVNEVLRLINPDLAIRGTHLVSLPTTGLEGIAAQVTRPDWSVLNQQSVWILALTIGIVASLESLLSLEATNKLDPWKREAPANRELFAQGLGNLTSGLLGGLPVTGVIVRSSANIDAGARTRLSGIVHGFMLLVAVLALATILNRIPLAALAAVLLVTGFKLTTPALWKNVWDLGWAQFIPFAVTIVAILFTDLLKGIGVGLFVGIAFILVEHMRRPALVLVSPPGAILTRYLLPDQVTFLSKASISRVLESFTEGMRVEIDGRRTTSYDQDVLEILNEFRETAKGRKIDYRLVGVPTSDITPLH
ncbi:MAG: SulP family inorganic anion transporter [Gemmatimonadaceae bacterium]|nr:SulP family inorganic anion transporter [Gemmatimonadaceae bacterium]